MLGKKGAAKGGQTNSKDVLSATELGLKAKSLGIMKKPMTQKGKKILLHKAPKIEENEKTSIFIKGNKASQNMQDLMKDLHSMRDPALSKLFFEKGARLASFRRHWSCGAYGGQTRCQPFLILLSPKKESRQPRLWQDVCRAYS